MLGMSYPEERSTYHHIGVKAIANMYNASDKFATVGVVCRS